MDSDRSYWTGWGGPQSPLLHGVDIDHPKRIEGDDVKLTDRVVAFVDILGFRSLVENSTMESAVSTVVSLEEALYHIGNRPHHDFEVSKLFSDTIYFSAPVHWQGVNWVFGKSMVAQALFLERGFLVRGGVSSGLHYESKKVIFSRSLIKSYDLEREVARFPRIVVDPDLLAVAAGFERGDRNEPQNASDPNFCAPLPSELVLRDSDGVFFLDYMRMLDLMPDLADVHIGMIKQGAKLYAESPRILSKFKWMAEYHDREDRYGASASATVLLSTLFAV